MPLFLLYDTIYVILGKEFPDSLAGICIINSRLLLIGIKINNVIGLIFL